jgi:hypothetical protein
MTARRADRVRREMVIRAQSRMSPATSPGRIYRGRCGCWEVLRIIAATIWVEHRLRFARERGRTSDYQSGGVGGSPLEPDCIIEGLWSAMRTHPEGELFSIIGLGVQ